MSHPLLVHSLALQKSALYSLPAAASTLYLVSLIYYVISKRSEGRNFKASKILLGISSALGVSGALAAMTSAKAMHEVGRLLGNHGVGEDGIDIKDGSWEGVGLCVAAGLHFVVVVYAACGMPGWPSFGGYIGKRYL
jgi:hypothetical protein